MIKGYEQYYTNCTLCPRFCRVDRTSGEYGICGELNSMRIASSGLHFGEEPILVGTGGSGTIFFTGCSLHCRYCQNMDISQPRSPQGVPTSIEELAVIALDLQRRGAANINVVTPTHFSPSILAAISLARTQGLSVPLVYNTSGYETEEALTMIDSAVDLYLLDIKTLDRAVASHYCGSADYPEVIEAVASFIAEQKPQTKIATDGSLSGTLVRHLIFPGTFSATKQFLQWYGSFFAQHSWLSLLTHFYNPETGVRCFSLSGEEYEELVDLLYMLRIENGYLSTPTGRSQWLGDLSPRHRTR